ncbi:hypothetical protein ACFVRU_40350, partial [Streptomyces sp. NPDC057927]
MGTVCRTYPCGMDTGSAETAGDTVGSTAAEPVWTGLPPGLLRMRRLLLVLSAAPPIPTMVSVGGVMGT